MIGLKNGYCSHNIIVTQATAQETIGMLDIANLTKSRQLHAYFALFVFLSILWICYAYCFNTPIFPLDDGFIVLHNAQVLHDGYDRNYVGVPALAGATSPLHLLVLYVLLFFISPLWAMATANWLAIIAFGLGLLRLAFIFRASFLQATLFCISGLTIGLMIFQLLNGLETGLSLAAVTWLLCLSINPTQRILRSIICGLLPFLHPELLLLSVSLWGFYGWQYWQRDREIKSVFRYLAEDAGWMGLAALPWIMWYWWSFGTPYPLTISAKQAFFAQLYLPFLAKWKIFYKYFINFIFFMGYFNGIGMILLLLLTPLGRTGFFSLSCFFLLYLFIYPDGLEMNYQRYIYANFPVLLFGLISCINYPQKLIRGLANAILIYTAICSFFMFPLRVRDFIYFSVVQTVKQTHVASWTMKNLPSNSVLLILDAGYMAYATPFHLIDLVGLKTPAMIRFHQQYTLPSVGKDRSKAIAAIISATHPNYLIDFPIWEHGLGILQNLDSYGWHLQMVHFHGKDGYRVYKILPKASNNELLYWRQSL
ncbi:MAG: hypothetical protein A3F18_06800 [Legionellales bacterium RIFCSPHIGHO2_12_FULL_37_14]|nr:MAG: hypothetical protein A3F18_06800 [Legionellales bacterium RIFCSPHIGHO2_12_FULL_37_14]